MKGTIRTISLMSAAAVAAAAFADRTPPSGTATLYGDWSVQQAINTGTLAWTNSTDATRIAWTQDSYGIVQKVWTSGNFSLNGLHFWGLKWDTSTSRWATQSKDVWIGAGGLEMPKDRGGLYFGNQSNEARLYLTASQTWTGPDSGRAHFGFGHDNYANFYKMRVSGDYCPAWTLEKGINVWITWTNHFTKTDVTVKYPARIWLEREWTTSSAAVSGAPALNAKSLTLAGDGTMWEAGGTASVANSYKTPELEPEMNSVTVSPSLTLKDGADLLGRSAGWDIPTLSVAGTGESSFDGTWAFRRSVTDVSIASGSVLALKGTVSDGGVPAGLNVTGSGTLKLDPSTFRLTGGLTLGADITLVLAGHGEFSHRIDGGKEIRIESSGNDVANAIVLRASALEGFTGNRVTVASGRAAVDAKDGVAIVEDGGTLIDLSAVSDDPWVVTDAVRPEATITVGAGETLHILGNGLTAATALVLNGGRVAFVRSAAIGSPITVLATSSIGAESATVTGTLLGHIDGSLDSGSMELSLKGVGTVNLAGGCNLLRTSMRVREGRANFMTNRFTIAYANWGVYEGDYLGIRDGAYVDCPWPSAGGVYGCYSYPKNGATSVVEVFSNATVNCEQNRTFYLGNWHSDGVLRISGGKVVVRHGTILYVGYTTGTQGVIEMNDGVFLTDQAFRTGNGASGRVVWRGGLIKLHADFWTYAGNPSRYFDGTSSNITFTIAGPDCVLDLSGAAAFTNVVANAYNAESWQWAEGGRLTVTNGGTFVMNRFPENGRVAVKDCNLLIADERAPAIGEIGFAGTTDDVISGADGLNLSAQGVRVLGGGEWSAAQVLGIGWSDLTFDDGAVLRIEMTGNDAVPLCSVPGDLSLGETVGFRLVRNGYKLSAPKIAAITAAGAVTGSPASFAVEPAKWVALEADGDSLWLTYRPKGIIISFK